MNEIYFNADAGYLEGIVRGYRDGLISGAQYLNLTQCETMDDLKLQLATTDYSTFLQNEPSPMSTSTLSARCTDALVGEFQYLQQNAAEPISKFLDYITYGYMIDNVILLITGTLHERDTHDLLEKCHPLGFFDSMPALCVATTVQELYGTVLVDSPLAAYFRECLSAEDLNELNIEIIRNTLHKAYLEDFYAYCMQLGDPTSSVMGEILRFEADRRTVNITINSFGTELSKDDRAKLYPRLGNMYPEAQMRLARVDDMDQVKAVLEQYSEYKSMVVGVNLNASSGGAGGNELSLEDRFFIKEVQYNKDSFEQQFHYGVFYAWLRLKEQEIRNVVWIAECISQQQKDKINNYTPIY
ncbi:H(+)-transporting V0 sector ATPase subunit d [Coemansia sp. RSA 353]|nr:H(+)-transporting V0 sector ATPase subunit d [Coemansia sp. RSA 1591]KAJ1763789.1 H(+)-transporting V0 sector ATPase subunit d [Coemansia sp. RSA 1752]KAJ1784845.1 H(+)-transporting V0 sector ATPase subunit d [Coemansia sp. RSA 2167]KAJ1790213.1 H(+)-transporting V0 sector ATPase subunit d [Coemansia sp. RSA 1938]KAJ2132519.1 H(+)-transporting V0 sector ATPase subunit d [Coemansia sp. RSA 921]KAJ2142422.1 H(+)-transporting V0 sector ATPase subunit d [Coemansia sp. RSA 564]KAJ2152420.1 H(+)